MSRGSQFTMDRVVRIDMTRPHFISLQSHPNGISTCISKLQYPIQFITQLIQPGLSDCQAQKLQSTIASGAAFYAYMYTLLGHAHEMVVAFMPFTRFWT